MTLSERQQFQQIPEYDDLSCAVKKALGKQGVLAKIRAEMIYSVFQCAKDASGDSMMLRMGTSSLDAFSRTDVGKNTMALIRELLEALGMEFTVKVFDAESGLDEQPGAQFASPKVAVQDARLPKLVAEAQPVVHDQKSVLARTATESCSAISAAWEAQDDGSGILFPENLQAEDKGASPEASLGSTTPVSQPEQQQINLPGPETYGSLERKLSPQLQERQAQGSSTGATSTLAACASSDPPQEQAPVEADLDVSDSSFSQSPPPLDAIDVAMPSSPHDARYQAYGSEQHQTQTTHHGSHTVEDTVEDEEDIPEEIEQVNSDEYDSGDDIFTDIGSFKFESPSGTCAISPSNLSAEIADLAPPDKQNAYTPDVLQSQPENTINEMVSSDESSRDRRDRGIYDLLCDDALYEEELAMDVPSLPGV